MNVMDRKMFANRDARRKLANMGGIIASSPELLGTAQNFENGGLTFSSIFSRLMSPPTYDLSRLGSLDEPTQTGLDDIETVSPEAAKQMSVLSKARAGNSLAQIAKDTALDTADVINIIAGSAGLLVNELAGLTGDVLAVVTGAVNKDLGKAFGRKAEGIRSGGRDLFLKEGKVLPRVFDVDFAGDRREGIEQRLKESREGVTTTPEQRAAIQAQSEAAIARANPETLRDTGEAVPFTGRTNLLSVTPKAGVMSSLGGSEVLFDLLQGGDTVPDKTASVDFEGGDSIAPSVRSSSGPGEGIMSQAPGISVPNVDIGEAGLERAREIAEREAAIKKYLAEGPRDSYRPEVGPYSKQLEPFGPNNVFYGGRGMVNASSPVDVLDAFNEGEIYERDPRTQEIRDGILRGINNRYYNSTPTSRDPADQAVYDVNRRAIDFVNSDTYTPPSEIYGDVIGGDVPTIAKYQEASPEEVQAIRDRLAREAAADEAAKEQGFFTEKDEEIQAEYDEANAKQQAMLDADADAAALEDLKTTADKKVNPEETTADKKVNPEETTGGPNSNADNPIAGILEQAEKELTSGKISEKTSALTDTIVSAKGLNPGKMSLKEKTLEIRGVLDELLGYDDKEKQEEFWLNMALVGFGVAAGEDESALKNVADGLLVGANNMAKQSAARKERKDRTVLTAFGEALADQRAGEKFRQEKELAGIRASGSSLYGKRTDPLTLAFRLATDAVNSFEFDSIDEALAHYKGVVGREYKIDLGGTIDSDYTPKTAEELNTAAITRGDKTFVFKGNVYPVVTGS